MPNYNVRNFDVNELKTQIYGSQTDQAIATDNSGLLRIKSISDAISTDITGTVDIRELSADTDNILIYGYDGTNVQRIKTDTDGNTRTHLSARDFSEVSELNQPTGDNFTPLLSRNTSEQATYSFAVYNEGANTVDVKLDVSPNNTDWMTDVSTRSIPQNEMDVFFPATFLKYTRVSYKSTVVGNASTIDVYFNAQL